MLMTNELGVISEVIGPATQSSLVSEILSSILAVVIPVLLAFWRRSASKSKIQQAIIEVLVRGIEKSSEQVGEKDTTFVKMAVNEEAKAKGIEDHVEKAMDKVTTKMATEQNGNESARL